MEGRTSANTPYFRVRFEGLVIVAVEETNFRFVFYIFVIIEGEDEERRRGLTKIPFDEGFCIIVKDPVIAIEINDKIDGLGDLIMKISFKSIGNNPNLGAVCLGVQLESVFEYFIFSLASQ